MRLLLAVATLSAVTAPLQSQTAARPHRLSVGLSLLVGRETSMRSPASFANPPLCDGSELAHVQGRRTLARVLGYGGTAALGIALFTASSSPSSAGPLAVGGAGAGVVGFYMLYNTSLSPDFWDRALVGAHVGTTQPGDVRTCLGNPSATSISGGEELWTYSSMNVGYGGLLGMFGGSNASSRSVTFSFKDGLLTKVRRDETGYGR